MNETVRKTEIATSIGTISVYIKESTSGKLPLIFLHGIYLDHHLWDKQFEEIKDRTMIAVDMPFHGESRQNIKAYWTLNDCATMLIALLDGLKIHKVIAIGHSWGSMTILRAAQKHPERFEAVGLCNMSFLAATQKQKTAIGLQHSMLMFKGFYIRQSARSMFGKASLRENPSLLNQLKRPMSRLSNRQIRQTDKAVLVDAGDATALIETLKVKAIALRGEEDFVPTPPNIETIIVKGGHISPLERPSEVADFVRLLTAQG